MNSLYRVSAVHKRREIVKPAFSSQWIPFPKIPLEPLRRRERHVIHVRVTKYTVSCNNFNLCTRYGRLCTETIGWIFKQSVDKIQQKRGLNRFHSGIPKYVRLLYHN